MATSTLCHQFHSLKHSLIYGDRKDEETPCLCVEGTIFNARNKINGMDYASTMWQPLAQSLGDEGIRREKELHDRWESGRFDDYLDWVEATYKMHKELGLRKQTFDHLLSCAEYNPGVTEFFEKLNRKQFIPVLISGGFQELVRRAQQELRIPHGHGACEYTFDKDDSLLRSCSLVPCDFAGKFKFVSMLIERYKLKANFDWIFIGDGKNDCDIASKAPISFAFNGHQRLKDVVTHHIDDRDGVPASFNGISTILDALTESDYIIGNERKNARARAKAESINNARLSKKMIAKESKEEVEIQLEDYQKRPELHLSEILEEHRIAFVGLRKSHPPFKKLKEHFADKPNFKLFEADFENTNKVANALNHREFIFFDVGCISHSQVEQIKSYAPGAPVKGIKRLPGYLNDVEPLERAMANVLYRHFYARDVKDEN